MLCQEALILREWNLVYLSNLERKKKFAPKKISSRNQISCFDDQFISWEEEIPYFLQIKANTCWNEKELLYFDLF